MSNDVDHAERDAHLTLTQAAKIAPGRPSTNCMWRWCRRGVLARGGERVRLEHIRVGGKIFTTARWVLDFGRRLADADRAHFDRPDPCNEPRVPVHGAAVSRHQRRLIPSNEEIERELEEAGL